MNTSQTREQLKRLEWLQKKGRLSKTARRQINVAVASTVLQHNQLRTGELQRERRQTLTDKNTDSVRELFNKHGKGRIVIGPK